MSGTNTKAQKIDRILARQVESNEDIQNIFALIRLGHETDLATIEKLTATNKLLTETAHRQDAEIVALRRQLGLALAKLRQPVAKFNETFPFLAIPTLEAICSCAPGICKGDWKSCRHPLEPKWGNHPDPVPHNTKGTV